MWQIKKIFSTFSTKPKVVFILGGPCSGKGTQSNLISKALLYKHLSAGQLLREQRKRSQSKYGELIQRIIIEGVIVPSHITVSLLQKAMKESSNEFDKFLIDGFPRNVQNLQKWNKEMGQKVNTPFIIYLSCSEQTMIKRLEKRSATSTRSDDKIQVIRKRFKTFEEQTLPVIEWFRIKKTVLQVSAQGSPNEIFDRLKNQIGRSEKFD